MSRSLDDYIADLNDGVAEVFDWYLTSGNVEFHSGGSDPPDVQGVSTQREAPSRSVVRTRWSDHPFLASARSISSVTFRGTSESARIDECVHITGLVASPTIRLSPAVCEWRGESED